MLVFDFFAIFEKHINILYSHLHKLLNFQAYALAPKTKSPPGGAIDYFELDLILTKDHLHFLNKR